MNNRNKLSVDHEDGSIFVMIDGTTVKINMMEARKFRNDLNDSIDTCCYEYNKLQIQKSYLGDK